MADWWGITGRDLGWCGNLERRVMRWLHTRFLDRLLSRYGGIQRCPWCKQCAQAYDGTHFDSESDPMIDALHCGNCGGVSRFRFELGMIALDPIGLAPPPVPTVRKKEDPSHG